MSKKTTEIIREIVEPEIEKMNIDLVEVEFVKEGAKTFLRLFIDKQGGISLDDCENVSKTVSPLIDEIDPIKEAYVFEVSSPGLDRPLKNEKDFTRYKGELIEVGLYMPIDGKKSFEGYLENKEKNMLTIKTEEGTLLDFDMKTVSIVKRAIRF